MADHVAVLRRMRDNAAGTVLDHPKGLAALDHAIATCEQHAALVARLGELEASNADLLQACKASLSRLPHNASCASVRPTTEWKEHGSMSFDKCACEIRLVQAAIAKADDLARVVKEAG